MTESPQPIALVTGAYQGLGRALAHTLADRGWHVVVDARDGAALNAASAGRRRIVPVPGDVTDPRHQDALAFAVASFGRLDLLVNNASDLGASPLPSVAELPPAVFRRILEVDVVAPLALTQRLLPWLLESHGIVLNISSDAAVEPYAGWAGYGSAKAALDQLSAVLGVEAPRLRTYAVDPGDMRTAMHQAAFPGEDISDRPAPETVVPALVRLLDERPPSGRYTATELADRSVPA